MTLRNPLSVETLRISDELEHIDRIAILNGQAYIMPGMRIEMPSFWRWHLIGHRGIQSRIDARVGGERRSADVGLHMQCERTLGDGCSAAEGEWAVPACGLESRSPHADTKIIVTIDTLLIFLVKEEFDILSSIDVWKVVINHFRTQAADRPQTPFRGRHGPI